MVTALTAQNTRGVRAIHYPPPGIVGAQIDAIFEDFDVAAIKIGVLGGAEIADVVAERLSSPHSPSRDGRPSERPLGRGRETLSLVGSSGGPDEGFRRLRSGHDRILRRRAERQRLGLLYLRRLFPSFSLS